MSQRLLRTIQTNVASFIHQDALRPPPRATFTSVDGFDDDADRADTAAGGGGDNAQSAVDVPPTARDTLYLEVGARQAADAAGNLTVDVGFNIDTPASDSDWREAADLVLGSGGRTSVADFVKAVLASPTGVSTSAELVPPLRLAARDAAMVAAAACDADSASSAVAAVAKAIRLCPPSAAGVSRDPLLVAAEDAAWLVRLRAIMPPKKAQATSGDGGDDDNKDPATTQALPRQPLASVQNLKELGLALEAAEHGKNASLAATFVLSKAMKCAMGSQPPEVFLEAAVAVLVACDAVASVVPGSAAAAALQTAFTDGVMTGITKLAVKSADKASQQPTEDGESSAAGEIKVQSTLSAKIKEEPKKKEAAKPASSSTTTGTAAASTAASAPAAAAGAAASSDGAAASGGDAAAAERTGDGANAGGDTAAGGANEEVDAATADAIREAQEDLDRGGDSDGGDSDEERGNQRRRSGYRRRKKKTNVKVPPQWRVPLLVTPLATSVEITVDELSEGRIHAVAADDEGNATTLKKGESATINLPSSAAGRSHVVFVSSTGHNAKVSYTASVPAVADANAAGLVHRACAMLVNAVAALRMGLQPVGVQTLQASQAAAASAEKASTTEGTDAAAAADGGETAEGAAAAPSSVATTAAAEDDEDKAAEDVRVAPLLRAGLVKAPVHNGAAQLVADAAERPDVDTAKLKLLYTRTFARNPTMEACVRAAMAVTWRHSATWDEAAAEVGRQWMSRFANALQGEPGRPKRERLVDLATWLTGRIGVRRDDDAAGSKAALDHLFALLSSDVPIAELEGLLARCERGAQLLASALDLGLKQLELKTPAGEAAAAQVAAMLGLVADTRSLNSVADGATDAAATRLSQAIASFQGAVLKSCPPSSAIHTLILDVATRSWSPAAAEHIGVEMTRAAEHAATLCKQSKGADPDDLERSPMARYHSPVQGVNFASNRQGVAISRGLQGTSIDVAGQGVHCLRSTIPWPLKFRAGGSTCQYVEVAVNAKHKNTVKRIAVGFADPLADVSSFAAVNKANKKYRVVVLDSASISEEHYVMPLGACDVVGCGLDLAARQVVFTVNGGVVTRRPFDEADEVGQVGGGDVPGSQLAGAAASGAKARSASEMVPFVVYDSTDRCNVIVNTGEAPFTADPRSLLRQPAAESASSSSALRHSMRVLQRVMRLVRTNIDEGSSAARELCEQARTIASEMLKAATSASELADGNDPNLNLVVDTACGIVRDELLSQDDVTSAAPTAATSVAELLRTYLIPLAEKATANAKATGLRLIADIIDRVPAAAETVAEGLASLGIAAALPEPRGSRPPAVPYQPVWEATPRDDAVTLNGSYARTGKKQVLGHAVGTSLPTKGTTTFSVSISTENPEVRGLLGYGQLYIGVASAPLATLGTLGWKAAEPPVVWALHSDMNSQLGHANVSAFGLDPFLFAPGTVLTVAVDRDRGTVSFSRGQRLFTDVFSGLPRDAELRPFVQLVGEYSQAILIPGTREQAITPATVCQREGTRILRRLITLRCGSEAVANCCAEDLEFTPSSSSSDDSAGGDSWQKNLRRKLRALTVLGALGDPAAAQLAGPAGRTSCIVEGTVGDSNIVRVAIAGEASRLRVPSSDIHVANKHMAMDALRIPAAATAPEYMTPVTSFEDPFADDSDEDDLAGGGDADSKLLTAEGLQKCVDVAADIVSAWCNFEVLAEDLMSSEAQVRAAIIDESDAALVALGNDLRSQRFPALAAKNANMAAALLMPPTVHRAPTFNKQHSSNGAEFPAHYRQHLMVTPDSGRGGDDAAARGPWVGVANEAIATSGVINIRIYVNVEWRGLLPGFLGVGFRNGGFAGLCTDAYHGAARKHASRDAADPDMWALPFRDVPQYHMKHCKQVARNFTLVPSNSIIRMHINRTRRTMEVFVGSARGEGETNLGVLYDDLPVGVPLYPFVELPNPGACAMFLPDGAPLVRPVENSVRYAHLIGDTKSHNRHMCDGCINELSENALDMPQWYRCNTCADIDLCGNCFTAHVHCGHTFTQITQSSFIESPLENGAGCDRNANVEVPAAPVTLLTTNGLVVDETSFDTTATVKQDNATAAWGLLRKHTETAVTEVTCTVSWPNAATASPKVTVGVCPASQLPVAAADPTVAAFERLATAEPQGGQLPAVAVATHASIVPLQASVNASRRGTVKLRNNEAVTFVISAQTVDCLIGGSPVWRVRRAAWATTPLALFVAARDAMGLKIDLRPRASRSFLVGKVAETTGSRQIRVGSNAAYRWVTTTAVRTPLVVCKNIGQLQLGCAVFTANISENRFIPCTVSKIDSASETPVWVDDGSRKINVGLSSVFLSETEAKKSEAKTQEESFIDPMDLQRMRMRRFYSKYAPEKTDADIDKALIAYSKIQGGLDKMWTALKSKYGPEPEETADTVVADVRYMRRALRADGSGGQPSIDELAAFTVTRLLRVITDFSAGRNAVSALGHVAKLAPALARVSVFMASSGSSQEANTEDSVPVDELLVRAGVPRGRDPQASEQGTRGANSRDDKMKTGQTQSSDWWTAAEATGELPCFDARLPAARLVAGTPAGTWQGELLAGAGFALPLRVDTEQKLAWLEVPGAVDSERPEDGVLDGSLSLSIAESTSNAAIGTATWTFVFAEPDSSRRQAFVTRLNAVAHDPSRSKTSSFTCPAELSGQAEGVCLRVNMRLVGDGEGTAEWLAPSGAAGSGQLSSATMASEADDSPPNAPQIAMLPRISFERPASCSGASGKPQAAASFTHRAVLGRVGLEAHLQLLYAASDAPLPPAPDLFRELQRLLRLASAAAAAQGHNAEEAARRLAAVLHSVQSKSPAAYADVMRCALAVGSAAAPQQHYSSLELDASATLLQLALEISSPTFDLSADATFWPCFAAVVRIAHCQPTAANVRIVKQYALQRTTAKATAALLSRLRDAFDAQFRSGARSRALCAAADLFSLVAAEHGSSSRSEGQSLPTREIAFLVDAANALKDGQPLPACADIDFGRLQEGRCRWLPVVSSFKPGEIRGERLMKGRARTSAPISGRRYFELQVVRNARIIVGVGTSAHGRNKNPLGEDSDSFGFDGTSLFRSEDCPRHGWAVASPGGVLGCLIDVPARTVTFNIGGEAFNAVPFPEGWKSDDVFAYAQVSATTDGTPMHSTAETCRHLPPQAQAIQVVDHSIATAYDPGKRSATATMTLEQYVAIAAHMNDAEKNQLPPDMLATVAAQYERHIQAVERSMLACWGLIDPSDSGSRPGQAVAVLKRVVTKKFRDEHLCVVPPVEERKNRRALPQVTVRWYDLFSERKRTPLESLQKCVLGQLHRQIGQDLNFFRQTPMFMTSLVMTDSGHVPIDAGGPYNQVWSLLSEELMTDANVKPNFHRNPLFRFVTNPSGTFIVPDATCSSPFELSHFRLLGRIMGHMVRANTVLAFEISPFVWKFLVDDTLTADDFFTDVEPTLQQIIADDDALADIDTYLPSAAKHFDHFRKAAAFANASDAEVRRAAAEHALVHGMDAQLRAMRDGLWEILGSRCAKAMTWRDLELRVCGLPYPDFEQFQSSVKCTLPPEHAAMFWQAMKSMTPQEWGAFFYFAAAQKRYPLTRKITVQPSGSSPDHIPTASTCFATVAIPPYRTVADYTTKLRQAIACQDMELA